MGRGTAVGAGGLDVSSLRMIGRLNIRARQVSLSARSVIGDW